KPCCVTFWAVSGSATAIAAQMSNVNLCMTSPGLNCTRSAAACWPCRTREVSEVRGERVFPARLSPQSARRLPRHQDHGAVARLRRSHVEVRVDDRHARAVRLRLDLGRFVLPLRLG